MTRGQGIAGHEQDRPWILVSMVSAKKDD